MRFEFGIIKGRVWALEYYRRDAWEPADRHAWRFLLHWPKYDDYWIRICGVTLSGRKGLAEMYRMLAASPKGEGG